MTIDEQKYLTTGKAGKVLAIELENNTTPDATSILNFFAIKRDGRAAAGILKAINENDTELINLIKDMVGNAPVVYADKHNLTPSMTIVGVICIGYALYLRVYDSTTKKFSNVFAFDQYNYSNQCV
jgi:hypothetical protein